MLSPLLLSLFGAAAAAFVIDGLFNDDDDQDDGAQTDDVVDDGTADDDTGGDETTDDDDTPAETSLEGGTISEDTTIVIDQDELDALIAIGQSVGDEENDDNMGETAGDVPAYILTGDSTLSLDIDGEIDGYLHTVTYVDGFNSETSSDITYSTAVIWSPDAEITNPVTGSYTTDFDISAGLDEDDVLLFTAQTSDLSVDTLNGDLTTVEDKGTLDIDAGDFASTDETYVLPDTTVSGESYFPYDGDYIPYDELIDDYFEAGTADVEVTEDVTITLDQSQVDQLIADSEENGETLSYFSETDGNTLTLELPEAEGTYYHLITNEGNPADVHAMLVSSDSPDAPEVILDANQGGMYFLEDSVEPILSIRLSHYDVTGGEDGTGAFETLGIESDQLSTGTPTFTS